MHPVHIGVGRRPYEYYCNAALHAVFDIQRMLQQIEFLIFVNHFFGEPETDL